MTQSCKPDPLSLYPAGLYLIATPIGNLGDITARAIETLKHLDTLYCEDTRVTGGLLQHLGVSCRMIPYDDHHAAMREAEILQGLAAGQRIGLCSDAGMPLISDPGYKLVRAVTEAGYAVTSLPGANAVLTALQLSALPTDRFMFQGFLPAKATARREIIAQLAALPMTLVFYETAPRLADSMSDMLAGFGDRPAAVARELTKKFEQTRRGTLSQLLDSINDTPPRGEIVVVVAGAPDTQMVATPAALNDLLAALLPHYPTRQVADIAAAATGLPRRDVYNACLKYRDQAE
ncbi:MAG: 16S rRNA (cytidine(1402)-2'-O)-methyltransferase [Pseudomonadota bacterium]